MRKGSSFGCLSRHGGALVLGLLFGIQTVAGVPARQATRLQPLAPGTEQNADRSLEPSLDEERDAIMRTLYLQMAAGAPFALEEEAILRRWAADTGVSDLEADVAISRALYARYLASAPLSDEQNRLLQEYEALTRRRADGIADRKARLLAEREAAEKLDAPNVPLTPPPNDTCAGAETIPSAGPFPYLTSVTADITDATSTGDPAAPACQTSVSRSIWYAFSPATTAVYTISTCADAPTATTVDDTVIGIYTSAGGCAGPFTILPTGATTSGCDDDSCANEDNQAVVTTQLTGGTTYYVVVWEFGSAAPTSGNTAVQIRVGQAPLPTNDTCASAAALTLNRATAGTTKSATNDYQLNSGSTCFSGLGQIASTAAGRDVVYSFRAASAGSYSFRVSGFAETSNPVLYLASTCPAATPGTPVTVPCTAASNRTTGSSEEITCVAMTANQQVFLFVDEAALTVGSDFTVEAASCARENEPNNATGQATTFSCGMEGSATPAGDADFFSIGSPAANSRVFAVVDGSASGSSDYDLRLTSATDTLEFDDADDDVPLGALAPNISGARAVGGPAFLRVNLHNGGGQAEPYRLYSVTQPASTSATPESEPNNTTAQADGAPNNYFTGSLPGPDPSTDVDVYATPASVGDVLVVQLDGDPTRDGTPLNAALDLLDSTGATLVSVNDGNGNESTVSGAGSLTATSPRSPGEAIVYRIRTAGTYYVRVSSGVATAGGSGTGDYLLSIAKNCSIGGGGTGASAGTDTIGIYVGSSSAFFLKNANTNGPADVVVGFGGTGQGFVGIRGDWNGDGIDTIGLYQPSTGAFFLKNSNTPGAADIVLFFGPGGGGYTPLAGDWNGDGVDTIGIFNSATATFFLKNTNTSGVADIAFGFGAGGQGYVAVAGDWNNNGTDTVGIYQPSTGAFFLRNQNAPGGADLTFFFGAPAGYVPIAGDWNGDGADSIGLYLPTNGTFFLKNTNSSGPADVTLGFGVGGAVPLGGDWDGQ